MTVECYLFLWQKDGQAYLKVLMDNVFVKNDFVGTFIWRNTDNADSLGKKKVVSGVEYIHVWKERWKTQVFVGL